MCGLNEKVTSEETTAYGPSKSVDRSFRRRIFSQKKRRFWCKGVSVQAAGNELSILNFIVDTSNKERKALESKVIPLAELSARLTRPLRG